MSWFAPLVSNPAFITLVSLSLAVVLIYWRSGSLHPIHLRLLRLFLHKDDVSDETIKKHVSDQSSLTAFRMISGIRARTLQDAKAVASFAESRNIPLTLIADAQDSFDIRKLSINENRLLARSVLLILALSLFAMIMLSFALIAVASSDRLLVSLKSSNTWLWLGETSVSAAAPRIQGSRARLSGTSCKDPNAALTSGFPPADSRIICDILGDTTLGEHIEEKLPEQRYAALAALALTLWLGWAALGTIRRSFAAIQLRELLRGNSNEDAAGPSRA